MKSKISREESLRMIECKLANIVVDEKLDEETKTSLMNRIAKLVSVLEGKYAREE